MVNTGITDIYGVVGSRLSESLYCWFAKLGIPDSMSDRSNIYGVCNPLFKVALPSYMEQVARSPQENDSDMTKVGSENLLVEILFRHTIMSFKVMGGGNPVPEATSSRVLG